MTTETKTRGRLFARNAMRERLWADDEFAHRWLCHADRDCEDGCDRAADPSRLELYLSEIES